MKKETKLTEDLLYPLSEEEKLRAKFIKSLIEQGKIGEGDLAPEGTVDISGLKKEFSPDPSPVRRWHERTNPIKFWHPGGTLVALTTFLGIAVVTKDINFVHMGTLVAGVSLFLGVLSHKFKT